MGILDLFAVAGMVGIPVCVGLTVAWLGARREARLRADLMRDMRHDAPERPSDLRRLQDTVEALAVEIERLGEGQRFTARILSERSAIDRHLGSGSPPRSITPH